MVKNTLKPLIFLLAIVSVVDFGTAEDSSWDQAGGQTQALDDRSVGDFPALIQLAEADAMERPASDSAAEMAGPMVTTVCALTVVLAVFGGLVWVSRRFGGTRPAPGALPDDVLRKLGSVAIDAKMRVTFLKVGTRILVIGQADGGQPQTLSEITDPEEVDRLTNRCLGRPEIIGRRSNPVGGVESIRRELAAG